MRNICILLLVALSLVACQEVVVENLTNNYTSGSQIRKEYSYSQWNNVFDFAVYGWIKINSALPRNEWSTVFHFTSNKDGAFKDYQTNGDRVLALFFIEYDGKRRLHFPTYSTATGNTNTYTTEADIGLATSDFDKWIFFYTSHGQDSKKHAQYVNVVGGSGEQKQVYNNIVHSTSNYYQIFVGQSVNYRFFQGSIWRLTIHGGAGAFREDKYDQLTSFNPNAAPTCVTAYSQCAFSGVSTNICESKPSFDVNSLKSIWVPSGKKATFYNQEQYQGKTVVYNQSIECITALNWALLVESGAISIIDNDSISRNSF